MPIVVTCRCGKRFAAKDHLFGRQVPCPTCGRAITIARDQRATDDGIYVACKCGRAFVAPQSMRGQQAQCRGCGRTIHVPGPDPIGVLPISAAAPSIAGTEEQTPGLEEDLAIPWGKLTLIGAVGGGILLVLIVVTTIVEYWPRRLDVVKGEHVSTLVDAARSKLAPPPQSTAESRSGSGNVATAPAAPPAVTLSPLVGLPTSGDLPSEGEKDADNPFAAAPGPRASAKNSSPAPAASALEHLPRGVEDWYSQPGARLTGIRRVNQTDPPIAHFSWLTGLLPFVGHGLLYQQFDFKQSLTKGKNLQLGAVIVPEFLNPLDDRQRWKGYPFDGIALTHFVGISGVEDARNVVAAKLPRSDPRAGVFGYDEIARPEEITDGKSQTIMVAGSGELANPWVFGGGATIRGAREPLFDKTSGLGMKGLAGGGTMVTMADGSVRRVSAAVDPKVFKAMCTIRGADSVDIEQASAPFTWESLKSQ